MVGKIPSKGKIKEVGSYKNKLARRGRMLIQQSVGIKRGHYPAEGPKERGERSGVGRKHA